MTTEQKSAAQTMAKYGILLVAAANPDEFYTMHGDMIDREYDLIKKEFSQTHYFGAACAFGTFGKSILARAQSAHHRFQKPGQPIRGASCHARMG